MKYYMPPEWQFHVRCWMAWPHTDNWSVDFQRVRAAYAAIANAISRFEPVVMLASPDDADAARASLLKEVEVFPIPLNDAWVRDSGPTFVFDRETHDKIGVSWKFNGWGRRFPHDEDQHMARRTAEHAGVECLVSKIVNEGGAIHVDGEGTCLLTEAVQLNANRNPGLSKTEIEQELSYWLGVEHFIWLPDGLVEDHTDGHVDQLACFVDPGRVVALSTNDKTDANYEILQHNLEILRSSVDAKGNPLEVIEIPQPRAEWADDVRLAKSYINFYIANGGIIMPSYGEPETDLIAYGLIQSCFPDRHVIQIDCRDLVTGGGNIHCITQQEPAL